MKQNWMGSHPLTNFWMSQSQNLTIAMCFFEVVDYINKLLHLVSNSILCELW